MAVKVMYRLANVEIIQNYFKVWEAIPDPLVTSYSYSFLFEKKNKAKHITTAGTELACEVAKN